jgi:vacuolar-type H+-ATPase subunit I/STV1
VGKRPRYSVDDELLNATTSFSSAGDRLHLVAELDEARLVAEQLRDKARAAEDELARHKEKTTKQLLFLESEVAQLRKEARERTDQYYEEKKKWQAKLRAVEADLDAARATSSSS